MALKITVQEFLDRFGDRGFEFHSHWEHQFTYKLDFPVYVRTSGGATVSVKHTAYAVLGNEYGDIYHSIFKANQKVNEQYIHLVYIKDNEGNLTHQSW